MLALEAMNNARLLCPVSVTKESLNKSTDSAVKR